MAIVLLGCSRKKDKFLNKNFHSLTTKYNFLFNGNNLYNLGILDLDNEVKEDFWTLIPIEKFNYYENEEARENNFTKAEEKATLAIQKHSMNVNGKERNPIMDEAYMLLGKSRYFDNRFIPALEAFNYILFKYPASKYVNEVKIWKEKINIRLGQNEYAIDNLKELLEEDNLLINERSIANSYLAQAFINIKQLDSAAFFLKKSNQQSNSIKKQPRKTFLLAQIYQDLSIADTAYSLYTDIIDLNRKVPREFFVNSFVKRSMVSTSIDSSIVELKLLAENFENNNFSDIIFHQIAMLNLRRSEQSGIQEGIFKKSDSAAVTYFNKSLRTESDDEILVAKNYNELAELNFRNKDYLQAGLYYDSTLSEINKRSREFRKIKKKRENLNDLIFYETLSIELDSVINLINMSKDQRLKYFSKYVLNLKNKQEKLKRKNKNFGSLNSLNSGIDANLALFYFYNPKAVAFGKNDFKNRWGNRRLQDNWRWSKSNENIERRQPKTMEISLNQDSILSPKYYMSLIPKDSIVIDSIRQRRNDAYFRLGAIYKDQFDEYSISNKKLFSLLESNPLDNLIPPSKYFIYKNFLQLDSLKKAEYFKNDIITNHKDSKYASILLDPQKSVKSIENATLIYEELYKEYDAQNYYNVIQECDKNILNFNNEPIVTKFELLKAMAIARVYGLKEFEKYLNFIKMNYSSTIEGKEAEYILSEVLPSLTNDKFYKNKVSDNYKIVYTFDSKFRDKINDQITELNKYIESIDYLDLRVSEDFYNNITTFVVVHGLKSYDGSLGLTERLERFIDNKAESFFVISSDNYKTIQIHKNLEKFEN
tara:strand:+ start:46296 stop:48761 length:2466 start_codon:yes stop_codon:yes gene_type:complete